MYRRSSGIYYADFRTLDGQRINKSLGTTNREEAKRKDLVLRSQYKLVFDDEIIEEETEKIENSLWQMTQEHYRNKWQYGARSGKEQLSQMKKIISITGNVDVNKITYEVVEELKQQLLKTGMKQATVNRHLHALSGVLKHASDRGCLRLLPKIRVYKEKAHRIKVYTPKEEAEIMKAASTDMKDLIQVLLHTGARLSEILTLQTQDVNFDSGLIHIWINKGDRPRSVPMTKAVQEILTRRISASDVPFNISMDKVQIEWRYIRRQCKREHDKEFVIHALRHTCASRLVRAGIDLYVVKEILGHSTIKITERYAHLDPNQLKSAIDIFNN